MRSSAFTFAFGSWLARLALWVGLSLLAGRLAAATLVATLDENMTQPGEPVTLAATFEGVKPAGPPALPVVPNLSITYLGQSSQIQIINGRTSTSVSFNYAVTASEPGEYTIPAIRVVVDGQTLISQPLKLVVGKGDGRLAQVAFLKLNVPKVVAFIGEAMALEIQLYAQGGRLAQPPGLKGDGVTVGKMIQTGATQTQTNGILYQVVSYQVPVTFVKTGEFALSAGDCLLDVQFRTQNRRRSRFGFDSMFDDVFGNFETRRLTLASEPVTVKVQSLPTDGVPPDFTGAVGDFVLSASVSTNVVTAGDPITLTVRLTGRGPVETLRWEGSSVWAGFKTYPPSTQVTNSDALGLSGTKTFEQAVIPENAQVKEIPAITFSFFHPTQRRYRTLSHPATPITVKPAAIAVAQPVVVAGAADAPAPAPTTDIVHIKSRPGALGQIAAPWVTRRGFLVLQCVPLAVWLLGLAWRRRTDRLANDPRLRRRRQVRRAVREGLAELRPAAAANRGEAFFVTTFRLLQEQLGERLDLPASAITEAVVDERLQPLGLEAGLLADTRELFQLCNQARYAPVQQPGELAALLPRIEATLRQLDAIRTDANR